MTIDPNPIAADPALTVPTHPQPTGQLADPQNPAPPASPTGTDATPSDAPTSSAAQPRRPLQVGDRRAAVPPTKRPGRGSRPPRQKPGAAGGAAEDADAESLLDKSLGGAGVEAPRAKVTPPSRRQPLSADLEQELQSMLAGTSMDELVGTTAAAPAVAPPDVDSRYRAVVMKIHGDDVFFSLGGRYEGVASVRQFREPPTLGMQLEVVVTGFNADDDLYEVTVPGGAVDVQDWSDLVEGTVVEARVTGANTGGLECMVGHVRGFIPASQIDVFRVEHFAEYYEKKLLCVVTEANERRKNLVLSHRAVLEREKEEQRQKLLEELQVGDVREGTVTNIRDFGAFVDVGGIEGLIHISQLSWDRVGHPSEVLQVGQKVRVKVEKIDPQTSKIGLSYRDLLDHPWTNIEQRFPEGAIVKGTVTRTAKFGAFVKLGPGIEGLVHISELAHHRVVQVTNVVKEGEEVEVKVLSVDPEAQRISLSLKEAHPMPKAEEAQPEEDHVEESPPKAIVPPRSGPLKGGTDRATGGDQFGLHW